MKIQYEDVRFLICILLNLFWGCIHGCEDEAVNKTDRLLSTPEAYMQHTGVGGGGKLINKEIKQ